MYLSNLPNVFLQVAKFIHAWRRWVSRLRLHFFKLQDVFVQVTRCICPICKKLQSNEIWSISEAWRRWESRLRGRMGKFNHIGSEHSAFSIVVDFRCLANILLHIDPAEFKIFLFIHSFQIVWIGESLTQQYWV